MLEFYRGSKARITTDYFELRGLNARRFAFAWMSSVRVTRGEPRRTGERPVLGVSALAAGLVVVPVVGPVSRLLAGLIVAVLIVQSLYLLWPQRVRWQLVAVYQGEAVVLFASTNRREFDQVCRGLQRCLEYRRSLG